MKKTLVLPLLLALVLGTLPVASMGKNRMVVTSNISVDWTDVVHPSPAAYGVEYGWVDQDRSLFLDRYHLLKPELLRVQISQEVFEPANDNADPNVSAIDFGLTVPLDTQNGKEMTYQDMFTTLAAEFPGLQFHINVWLAARWNASSSNGYMGLGGAFPPLNNAEHQEFIRELARWLVQTCGITPQRLSFSFINEPNLTPFFTGDTDGLVEMAQITRQALDQVSPQIRLIGLDEVHGTSWTAGFYPQRPAGCCDAWTYHVYKNGSAAMWSGLQQGLNGLSAYGPVWVTEFADTANGSPDGKMNFSTRSAALGFADSAGRLWGSGIDGVVHFRLADSYINYPPMNGWVGHGLFADWRGTKSGGKPYAIYPSFWVFANLFEFFTHGEVVSAAGPAELVVTPVRHTSSQGKNLAVWLTNPTGSSYQLSIQVDHFPSGSAGVKILDNLAGKTPVGIQEVSGSPLVVTLSLPAQTSYTVLITPEASRLYLPLLGSNH